jgi:hypothetical protein
VIENGARAVNIERRPELFRDAFQVHLLAAENAILIVERMHAKR